MSSRGFFAVIALTLSASLAGSAWAQARAEFPTAPGCDAGWIYFDLGNTLIDTRDWDHLKYFPETQAYLAQARALGYHLGLITNVPESWGKTAAEKITRLKAEVQAGFKDPGTSFDWSPFEDIFVPLTDAERKPAPILFERALAAHATCPHEYQGDEADQCAAADHVGLESYQVNVPGMPFFKPLR
jgi:phosphoglycolate phosphatase-like HAD superfamily hydrolase